MKYSIILSLEAIEDSGPDPFAGERWALASRLSPGKFGLMGSISKNYPQRINES